LNPWISILRGFALLLVLFADIRTLHANYTNHLDAVGNLLSVREPGKPEADVVNAYDALNRIISETSQGLRHRYKSYDAVGNRTQRYQPGAATRDYQYDYENRLVSLQDGTGSHAYTYDYRTRRIARQEPSGSVRITFSGGLSVQEFNSGGVQTEYVRGRDMGGGVGGLLYAVVGGQARFAHYNQRGDVTAETNGSGQVQYQATYEAFGTRLLTVGTSLLRQKANTKEEDPTGLLNEGFRYRDLETGIFLTRDPLGFVDGPNMYAYVRQNPWSRFDPLGLAELITSSVGAGHAKLDRREINAASRSLGLKPSHR